MDDKARLRHYGDAYEEIGEKQRSANRFVKTVVALDVAASTGNYFLAPDERLEFTVAPLIGGLVIWGINRYMNALTHSVQDSYIHAALISPDEESTEENDG